MLPPLRPWPFRIADENGKQFLGAIESIDTHSKAIIARELRNKGPEKRFNLADNCAIVSNGKLDTKLSNLRAGETVSLSVVENCAADGDLVAHWSFATARPSREIVDRVFPVDDRGAGDPKDGDPETIVRYKSESVYELSKDAFFLDLFARRFGARGICGGHGRFLPGASLPCHIHDFDESITIVKGTAICLVEGRQYPVSDFDTAFNPKGTPHRFLNQSGGEMAMIWVYAGSEPDRHIVDAKYCSGELAWPGAQVVLEHKSKV